jgi:DNA repair protein RecO (recombination protein O)
MALFQPLTILNLELSHSPRREIQRLVEATIDTPLVSIPQDMAKRSIALFMGDVLTRVAREDDNHEHLFNFIVQSVKLLEEISRGIADFHLIFLANLSKHLGFYPENNYSSTLKYFEGRSGLFVNHKTQFSLDEESSRLLSHILEAEYTDLGDLNMNKNSRREFLQIMVDFYSLHIPRFKEIQSLNILHEVFA